MGTACLPHSVPTWWTFKTDHTCALDDEEADKYLTLLSISDTMKYTWTDTKTKQEYTTRLDESTGLGMLFSKQCQIRMYAAVKLNSGVGVDELIAGRVESNTVCYCDSTAQVSIRLEVDWCVCVCVCVCVCLCVCVWLSA